MTKENICVLVITHLAFFFLLFDQRLHSTSKWALFFWEMFILKLFWTRGCFRGKRLRHGSPTIPTTKKALGLADIQNWNRNWHRNSEIEGAGPQGIDRRTSEPDIDAFDAIALWLWTRSDRPLHSTGIRQSGPSSGTQDTHTRYSFCVLCKRLLCHVIAKCRMCNKYVNLETVFAFFKCICQKLSLMTPTSSASPNPF